MQSNLAKALSYIFISEGGFAVRSNEPGGAVNMGVSMQTFANWRYPQPVTISDLQQLTVAEATKIYDSMYASHVNFTALPNGLDYCVLDAAVNEGIAAALIFLSLGLGISPYDKSLDFHTCVTNVANISLSKLKTKLLPLISGANLTDLINFICDNRLIEKRKRPEWPQFGPGWTNRIEYVRDNSMEMLGI